MTNAQQDARLDVIDRLNLEQNMRLDALEGLTLNVEGLRGSIDRNNRRANGGIATAMAMSGAILPPDANIALTLNLSSYRGEQGFAGALNMRATDRIYFNAALAGSSVSGSTGGRVGMTFVLD